MNISSKVVVVLLVLSWMGAGQRVQAAGSPLDRYNVLWDSPSQDENGTMPIGNGDLAANVWVEPSGDLLFYVSKSDAWTGGVDLQAPALIKLGRVRVRLDQPLFKDGTSFMQELDLKTGSIVIRATHTNQQQSVRFWIDANHPVIHVEIESGVPTTAKVMLESWRGPEAPNGQWFRGAAGHDVFLPTDGESVRWYQRNARSVFAGNLKGQHLEYMVDKIPDPLINRTFGGMMLGEGLKASDERTLVTTGPVRRVHVRIHALTEQTETPDAWVAHLEAQQKKEDAISLEKAWTEHVQWWTAFWDRSYIYASGTPDAVKASQAYQLQRWILACAGRGAYPIKFNGSLFTVEGRDAHTVRNPNGVAMPADYRRWGGGYWFQNTRLCYWPMLTSGDFDMMMPLFRMYCDMLPLLKERTQHYFNHDGVYFNETTQIWGLMLGGDFGKDNPGFYSETTFIRYYFHSGPELSAMMLDYYQYTGDEQFLRDMLLPLVDQVVLFYDQHYPRTADGKLHIAPAQVLETWHEAENPTPELVGLNQILTELLNLPDASTSEEQRTRWQRLLGELPDLPIAEEDGKRWLKPAYVYGNKRNQEDAELYSVFPYHLYGVGKPGLEIAQETYARRLHTDTGCWRQDGIHAAMLGCTEDAKNYLMENINTKLQPSPAKKGMPESRFPAFWFTGDWVPDQDHASVIVTILQRMLMSADRDWIRLLPAWPEDWNVSFKLHAPYQTVVEGRVENGEGVDLKVTPESREKNVIIVKKEK